MSAFSLHKRESSPFWFVSFRVPDPDNPGAFKQCTRSTKQAKKAEAKTAAANIVSAAHAEAGATTANGRAIYALLQGAAKLAEEGRLNIATGREILAQMIEAGGGGEFKRYTVKGWLQHWLEGKTEEHAKPGGKGKPRPYSPSTYTLYSGVLNQFLDGVTKEKVNGDILTLTADDIRQWRDSMKAEGRSGATVNDAVKTIRTALKSARTNGVVLANVAEAVDMLPEAESIRAVFTPEDFKRLLAVAEGDWRGVILTGWFTGASLRDITTLRWRQVDLDKGALAYSRRKSGTPVLMPLHDDLAAFLTELPATDDPNGFLFPSLAGKAAAGKSGLSMAFKAIMAKAGITGATEEAEGKAGRARNALSFHCLRHTCNSAMANAGVPQEVRMALVGQTQAKTNEIYTHRELGPLRAAIELLPGLPEVKATRGKRRGEQSNG
jgi:integrase